MDNHQPNAPFKSRNLDLVALLDVRGMGRPCYHFSDSGLNKLLRNNGVVELSKTTWGYDRSMADGRISSWTGVDIVSAAV